MPNGSDLVHANLLVHGLDPGNRGVDAGCRMTASIASIVRSALWHLDGNKEMIAGRVWGHPDFN
jgi:hypothetical protein